MKQPDRIKVAQFGLGPIGIETLRLASEKPWLKVVGAIDIDPAKVGRDLKELTGIESLHGLKVYPSFERLVRDTRPAIVFHTTVSKFRLAFRQIEPMAQAGVSVVSSCEELLFPQLREPKLATMLDKICRKSGSRVVGTGVNPGFVMDLLPLVMTGVSRSVDAVHIQRVVNASTRRGPLQQKIGSGWPPAKFRRLFRAGQAGHAGLKESLALIAHCLDWKIKDLTETGQPVLATKRIITKHVKVEKGETCGLHQYAEAKRNGKVCLTLDLKMYLEAPKPHDAIQIKGEPALDVIINGGVAGDQATVAALVNTAARLLDAPPGLLLMTDLSAPRAA
jgi:hypothetical protein